MDLFVNFETTIRGNEYIIILFLQLGFTFYVEMIIDILDDR